MSRCQSLAMYVKRLLWVHTICHKEEYWWEFMVCLQSSNLHLKNTKLAKFGIFSCLTLLKVTLYLSKSAIYCVYWYKTANLCQNSIEYWLFKDFEFDSLYPRVPLWERGNSWEALSAQLSVLLEQLIVEFQAWESR